MAHSKGPLSRAKKIEQASHVLQRSKCIAAIDFGTSSLSVAYTTPVTGGDIKVLPLYKSCERVPNAIVINVDKANNQYTTMEVGHRAQSIYSDNKRNAEKYIYFERIKNLLERDKVILTIANIKCNDNNSYSQLIVLLKSLPSLEDLII